MRTAHEIPDRRSPQLTVGEEVHAGDRYTEWPEFVFVTARDVTGWVPARHLSLPSGLAVVQTTYHTTELPTRVGEPLDVVAEDLESGWLWCLVHQCPRGQGSPKERCEGHQSAPCVRAVPGFPLRTTRMPHWTLPSDPTSERAAER